MVRFELVAVTRSEAGVGFVNIAIVEDRVDVTGKKEVPELVCDAEPSESGVVDVCRVRNPVGGAYPEQHPRHAFRLRGLGDDVDIAVARDGHRIDRKCRNPVLSNDLLGLEARAHKRIAAFHLPPLRARLSAFLASSSIKLSATSRSSDVSRL